MGLPTGWNRCWSLSNAGNLVFVIQIVCCRLAHNPGSGAHDFLSDRDEIQNGTGSARPVTSAELELIHVHHSADHPGSVAHWRTPHVAL
jgi:hypothetical protein